MSMIYIQCSILELNKYFKWKKETILPSHGSGLKLMVSDRTVYPMLFPLEGTFVTMIS